MSPVDHVRALWSAYRIGGMLASLEHVHAQCEWVPAPEFPDARCLHGAAEMRAYLERLAEAGVRLEPVVHTVEQLADGVVLAGGRMRVVSHSALSDSPLFWVYRTQGGVVVRIEAYSCRRDALAAAATRLAA